MKDKMRRRVTTYGQNTLNSNFYAYFIQALKVVNMKSKMKITLNFGMSGSGMKTLVGCEAAPGSGFVAEGLSGVLWAHQHTSLSRTLEKFIQGC